MIFGLPWPTFFLAIGVPAVSVILSLIYVATFRDGDDWMTIEDLREKLKRRK